MVFMRFAVVTESLLWSDDMEVRSNNASNAMKALVLRQFSPSRIESQLLVQVFELVCGANESRREAPRPGAVDQDNDTREAVESPLNAREAA